MDPGKARPTYVTGGAGCMGRSADKAAVPAGERFWARDQQISEPITRLVRRSADWFRRSGLYTCGRPSGL